MTPVMVSFFTKGFGGRGPPPFIFLFFHKKMTPLQKDPKQLGTIGKRVVYKSGLQDTRY